MTGEIHSCGYQDSGIAHNCCKIVDSLKKRIGELDEHCIYHFNKGIPDDVAEAQLEELQEIIGEKK